MKRHVDTEENRKMQKEIEADVCYSLALWGMAFVRHGSGRFVDLSSMPRKMRRKRKR